MKRINGVLPAAMQSPEILQAVRARALFREWPEIVGEMLAKKSWPDRYSKGTLWVAVEGSAWATELRMRKGEILERLRRRVQNPEVFKDVRFGVRPLPVDWETPTPPPDFDKAEEPEASAIEHLSIREIAERRLAKWKTRD